MASEATVKSPFYKIAVANGGGAGNTNTGSAWKDNFGDAEKNRGLWLQKIRFHWDNDKVRGVRWHRSDGVEIAKGDVASFGGQDRYDHVEYTFQEGEIAEDLHMNGTSYGYGSFQSMTLHTTRADGTTQGGINVGNDRGGTDWTSLVRGGVIVGTWGNLNSDNFLNAFGFIVATPGVSIRMTGVTYDLSHANLSNTKVVSLDTLTIDNSAGNLPQTSTVTSSQTYSSTSSWTKGASISIGTKVSVEASIPEIVKASWELSTTTTTTYNQGSDATMATTRQIAVPATVNPGQIVTAHLVVTQSDVSVPYTSNAVVTFQDGSQLPFNSYQGMYKGIASYNFAVQYDPPVTKH